MVFEEVDRIFQNLLEMVESHRLVRVSKAEAQVWRCIIELGKALMALFFASQREAWGVKRYIYDDCAYKVVDDEKATIGEIVCPTGVCSDASSISLYIPMGTESPSGFEDGGHLWTACEAIYGAGAAA